MNRECGSKNCKLWLVADSNPARWDKYLTNPLDELHPVRYNIWTSVCEEIQNKVFIHMDNRKVRRKF